MNNIDLVYRILFATEIIAFLVGVFYMRSLKRSKFILFVFYLGIIISSELLYDLLLKNNIKFQNLHIYFVIPLEFLFFHWLYYQFSTTREKRRIIVCGVIYIIAFFIERVFLNDPQKYSFSSFSYTIGNVVLLFVIFQYFIRLINSERILYFYHERLFWISCGLLLFYLGTSPYFGLNNYLYNSYPNIFWKYVYVMYFLNCSMYLLFAASFIWGKDK